MSISLLGGLRSVCVLVGGAGIGFPLGEITSGGPVGESSAITVGLCITFVALAFYVGVVLTTIKGNIKQLQEHQGRRDKEFDYNRAETLKVLQKMALRHRDGCDNCQNFSRKIHEDLIDLSGLGATSDGE